MVSGIAEKINQMLFVKVRHISQLLDSFIKRVGVYSVKASQVFDSSNAGKQNMEAKLSVDIEIHEEEKWIKHYSSLHEILLVGEGDFSFSVCLAKAFGSAPNMIATSLDSKEVLTKNFTKATSNLKELEERGCTILHEVDAHTMSQHPLLKLKSFDRIVFNFPHAGFHFPEHERPQIELHRKLVRGFLSNARNMLKENGEVHITHKLAYPFDRWEIEKLAEEAGLCLVEKECFRKVDYPGYENKKGAGSKCNKAFRVGESSTFKFAKALQKEQ